MKVIIVTNLDNIIREVTPVAEFANVETEFASKRMEYALMGDHVISLWDTEKNVTLLKEGVYSPETLTKMRHFLQNDDEVRELWEQHDSRVSEGTSVHLNIRLIKLFRREFPFLSLREAKWFSRRVR